jgi:hypothetical protein
MVIHISRALIRAVIFFQVMFLKPLWSGARQSLTEGTHIKAYVYFLPIVCRATMFYYRAGRRNGFSSPAAGSNGKKDFRLQLL